MSTGEERSVGTAVGMPARAADAAVDPDLVSVVIPVVSVAEDLEGLVEEIGRVLDGAGRRHEFVVVDDGTQGKVYEDLVRLKQSRPDIQMIRFHQSFGESVALTAGFERARGGRLLTVAPYHQVETEDLVGLLEPLDAGYDFVAGWRHPRVDPIPNRVQSAVFNSLARMFTKGKYHDLNCTVRAMRRKVAEEVSIYGDLFRFLPILAERQGFRITEIKLRHRRELGKVGFFGFGAYVRRILDLITMFFLTKFTKKPLRFFGLVGFFFMVLGVAVNLYLTYERLVPPYKGLADRPLLILGVLLIVLGMQIISIGLIGEIIIFTHAKTIKEYQVDKLLE
jgi:glycosyltransferase involved in cell wall biosynthesis